MSPDQLAELRTELQTQDNACTEHPLFCVFQKQGADQMSVIESNPIIQQLLIGAFVALVLSQW